MNRGHGKPIFRIAGGIAVVHPIAVASELLGIDTSGAIAVDGG